jgi:3-dehydrotetronate 4-kinase
MLLGAIADDFTGASDLANTLSKGGMATIQFVGAPEGPADAACEAGIVSLKSRSIPSAEAIRQSLAAADWLLAQGCRQILFKYCSTFDSTPHGNIGPVAEALLDRLGAEVAVVCPAFPAAGRRIFNGHLFVGDKLLSESGMQHHPLTPMTDPDLRRVLGRQIQGEGGFVGIEVVRAGVAATAAALAEESRAGRRLVVIDAIEDDDLLTIGTAIRGHRLITGGSGIALGLPENFREDGLLSGRGGALAPAIGPAVVLCGSCSATSQRQVALYLADHAGLRIDPVEITDRAMTLDRAIAFAADYWQDAPIFYSTASAEQRSTQAPRDRGRMAEEIEDFFATLAARLVDAGIRRLVVGGGETSGAVIQALNLRMLRIGREIDPGVPALNAPERNLGLALKSGNFGADNFFVKALACLTDP